MLYYRHYIINRKLNTPSACTSNSAAALLSGGNHASHSSKLPSLRNSSKSATCANIWTEYMSFYKPSTLHYSTRAETKTGLITNPAADYLFPSSVNKGSHTSGLGHTFNRICLRYATTIYPEPSGMAEKYYSRWIYLSFMLIQLTTWLYKRWKHS